jgi:DNA (cytosine-5)-methyltransferase 1
MKHGSLFSGIGGFDLAAEWMGWENVFHCEWNPFGQKVLKHHFPNSISYNDITKTDFSIHRGNIDIITGGFPCQPYSTAGLRKGKADERHLFPEMLRAIKEIQPTWVIGENVRGLVSWGGGLVFHEVCNDLEREGYEVQPFLIPAASVNAPHKRERIWFIAYSDGARREKLNTSAITNQQDIISGYALHSNGSSEQGEYVGQERKGKFDRPNSRDEFNNFQNFPTQSPICLGDDGLSDRLDSITFSKWRNESIKAGGNAIVPQVAYEIFKTIEKFENL